MEPIAKRLKQSAEFALQKKKTEPEEDIADQIKRLEAELQGGSDGSSDSETESEDDTANAVVNLSARRSARNRSRRNERAANEALELLGDALTFPKKVPFACKPCKFIGKNLEHFQAHRTSKEHLEHVQSGGKTLACVLCNKSFTSPAQLEEHRAGKWHKLRAQQKKVRHTVKVCYDFMRGECKWGDRCNFEHTETKAMRSGHALDKTRRRVCEDFARAKNCRFGDKCLFSHEEAK
ncbi:uncharacterized protein KRP23_15065 [Phytophthora ramorum]|uniref:uncharacterized protein n=1 Tax=Phytophthora ramorum TaxID=164328 RepID=UPI0030955CBF|nr:hypothetical protein KRP23_15065 [Phytophthora ramorum]